MANTYDRLDTLGLKARRMFERIENEMTAATEMASEAYCLCVDGGEVEETMDEFNDLMREVEHRLIGIAELVDEAAAILGK